MRHDCSCWICMFHPQCVGANRIRPFCVSFTVCDCVRCPVKTDYADMAASMTQWANLAEWIGLAVSMKEQTWWLVTGLSQSSPRKRIVSNLGNQTSPSQFEMNEEIEYTRHCRCVHTIQFCHVCQRATIAVRCHHPITYMCDEERCTTTCPKVSVNI